MGESTPDTDAFIAVAADMDGMHRDLWSLQILGSGIALGALALYLAMLGRGLITPLVAGIFVVLILFNSFDLDRPRRGFIHIPADPLVDVRASMDLEPAVPEP